MRCFVCVGVCVVRDRYGVSEVENVLCFSRDDVGQGSTHISGQYCNLGTKLRYRYQYRPGIASVL